jgi:hypothetical protein
MVVATFVLAPLPNWICGRCANPDDFGSEGGGSPLVDFGKFVTGFLVVMGVGESNYVLLNLVEGRRNERGLGVGLWKYDERGSGVRLAEGMLYEAMESGRRCDICSDRVELK